MGRFFSRLIFWAAVIGLFVYGYQNNWFSGITGAVNAVKSDVNYQKSLINQEDYEETDNGIISVEKTRSTKKNYGVNVRNHTQY